MFSGPGSAFDLLFEHRDGVGRGLPQELRAIYSGDWVIPADIDGPYSYSNFVMSHDGKVSFNVPGHEGGGDVSGFNPHDQWLMALTRSRADAVVVGANTLRTEFEHEWTAEFIYPAEAANFAEFRKSEGRALTPLQVIVTQSGDIRPDANICQDSRFTVVVATTDSGKQRVQEHNFANLEILSFGTEVDLRELYSKLHNDFGCETVLCEGGPRLYASVVLNGLLDEEFLTLSPVMVGGSVAINRPGLIDGVALEPGNNFQARLGSVRKSGDHLFIRTSWR
jgi:riboflavin biosynthesis pyrimidine reductase